MANAKYLRPVAITHGGKLVYFPTPVEYHGEIEWVHKFNNYPCSITIMWNWHYMWPCMVLTVKGKDYATAGGGYPYPVAIPVGECVIAGEKHDDGLLLIFDHGLDHGVFKSSIWMGTGTSGWNYDVHALLINYEYDVEDKEIVFPHKGKFMKGVYSVISQEKYPVPVPSTITANTLNLRNQDMEQIERDEWREDATAEKHKKYDDPWEYKKELLNR